MPHHAGSDRLSHHQADPAGTAGTGSARPASTPPSSHCEPAGPAWSPRRNQQRGRRRCAGGNTGPGRLRPTVRCGPCADEPAGWRGRRGCASADGSRGSWLGGGCSAGRSACSRSGSITILAPGAQWLAHSAGSDKRAAPEIGRNMVDRHTEVAVHAVAETAHESSTVRTDPGLGQTGARPRASANDKSACKLQVVRNELGTPEDAPGGPTRPNLVQLAVRHCERAGPLLGCRLEPPLQDVSQPLRRLTKGRPGRFGTPPQLVDNFVDYLRLTGLRRGGQFVRSGRDRAVGRKT